MSETFSTFFMKNSLVIRKFFVSLYPTKPVTRGRRGQNIEEIQRPPMPFVGHKPMEKGVYERYHSVLSNFAT